MKPRVCIDARMIRSSGIGTYLRGLLSGLTSLEGSQGTLVALGDPREAQRAGVLFEPLQVPIYSIREQFAVPRAFKRTGAELLHVPHYNIPVLMASQCVANVHDLIHLKFPQFLKSRAEQLYAHAFFQVFIPRCRQIFALSEYTKRDLITVLGIPENRIHVTVPGLPIGLRPVSKSESEPVLKKLNLKPGYFLYVGNLRGSKNIPALVRAYARLRTKDLSAPPLVLVGRSTLPGFEEMLRQSPSVLWLSGIDDATLPCVYAGAGAFVFPSLYEGFGFPPLEAMYYGIPVVCSNRTSLPEVVGDAALLFDPENEEAMTDAMQRILQDSSLRTALSEKGPKRAAQFSWADTARKTMAVYEECLR